MTTTKRKRIGAWKLLFLLFLIAGTIYILWGRRGMTYYENDGKIFGTSYHIKYEAKEDLQRYIIDAFAQVDNSLSTFNPRSTISRINRNEDLRTDSLLTEVYTLAREVSEATDGAFDITVAPLVNAWGFGFKHAESMTPARLDSLQALVGFRKVRLEGGRIVKDHAGTMLDCSAIAKGYGVDRVAAVLDSHGVKNYMVEVGGEIVVRGHNAQGKAWQIGVTRPVEEAREGEGDVQTVLPLTNCALATSGNYRNFYYKNGKRYAHTIDPKSGRPVAHSLLSASVIAPTCAMADAYATAFMVMGVDKARQVLRRQPQLKAYFIYSDPKTGQFRAWSNL